MTINVHFASRITSVNFYWSSLIRKEKREQNSVIYKNNLVSSKFFMDSLKKPRTENWYQLNDLRF